ncbi:RING-H2 finger protein ATL80-like [Phragmites australis]|uniref:RING-H2 finger protein ATL80-like n=1 Tax=Phragmites australis TaxID=29695 RepID=UPI002D775C8C|nr:RING-H2 finger protein ATL80-like [Phragmites australis]
MDGFDPPPGPVPAGGSLPMPASGSTLSNVGASGVTAGSVDLLFLYLARRFIWLYNKDAAGQVAAASPSSSRAAVPSLPISWPRRGVPLSLLPEFVHMAAPGAERAECAVCLAGFGEREAGRLLPRCGHGLHEECIATWLQVNTTCPLCRAPVAAK